MQQTFTYNSSNELIRVDDAVANKTVTYEYDYVGNITAVKTYIYTTGTLGTPLATQNYTYNSQNQRTDLSYDANGNMTSLNGFEFTLDGRRLSSAVSADTNISYTYNHNGIRTSKTVNGTTITYTVDENNNVIEQTDGTNTIKFVYDSNNSPIYMEYNGVTYYYEKNLQGDIVAILDVGGNTVVEYSYDIWGKLLGITGELADTLGVANPLCYRGYYYDTETQLYYLQSRYYSPDLMRFISQDDPVLSNDQGQPLGSNLYAYCLNNPVNMVDYDGKIPQWAITGAIHLAITAYGGGKGWATFQAVKGAIFAAANIYLSLKGYTITQALFNKFMWRGSLSTKTIDRMKQAFKNSSILTKEINKLLKTVKGNSVKELKGTVKFTSGDLYYAIHRASFYITGTKQSNNKWKLSVKVKDTFNFDSIWTLTQGFSIGGLANDLGWAMQKIGMGYVYTWSVTFSKVY